MASLLQLKVSFRGHTKHFTFSGTNERQSSLECGLTRHLSIQAQHIFSVSSLRTTNPSHKICVCNHLVCVLHHRCATYSIHVARIHLTWIHLRMIMFVFIFLQLIFAAVS